MVYQPPIFSPQQSELVVDYLLEKEDSVNVSLEPHGTPLQVAIAYGQKNLVDVLLARGAHVNPVDTTYGTPLWTASSKGRFEIAKLLVEMGAQIESGHEIPLLAATKNGHSNIVQLLLDKHGDNIPITDFRDALLAAALKGHKENVTMLLGSLMKIVDRLRLQEDSGYDSIITDDIGGALRAALGKAKSEEIVRLLKHGISTCCLPEK